MAKKRAKSTAAVTSKAQALQTSGTTVVVGDGWSALGSIVALLAKAPADRRIVWLPNTGSRLVPPITSLETVSATAQGTDKAEVSESGTQAFRAGIATWREIARFMGIETGEASDGVFLRQFRNKSFRPVAWTKTPSLEMRAETRMEMIWGPEVRLAPLAEARFEQNIWELEETIRARVMERFAAEAGRLERHEGVPVAGVRVVPTASGDQVTGVILGSGEVTECDQVWYADRWSSVPALVGVPKGLSLSRRRDAVGALQAVFTHKVALRAGVAESFYGDCHKDAGEEIERHVWGFFTADGKRSVWTVLLGAEEGEDNHQIGRKLRRLKQALDRMFVGSEWLPEGVKEFTDSVESEQVRYEEASLFGAGEAVVEPVAAPGLNGIAFMTDGYGPTAAFAQVKAAFGLEITVEAAADESDESSTAEDTSPSDESASVEETSAELNVEASSIEETPANESIE